MFAWFSLKSGVRGEADYLCQVDALRGWAILLVFFSTLGVSPEARQMRPPIRYGFPLWPRVGRG